MFNALLLIAVMVAAVMFVSWINQRHETRRADAGPTADEQVEALWDDFGGADDPAEARAALDALLGRIDVATLRRKNAVVALAVMAARTDRHDVLPELAAAARSLDGGCGETAALRVLAEACTGDVGRAREMYQASQSAMAGCGSCGTQGPGRFLLQEVTIMLDAMEPAAQGAGPSGVRT